MGQGGIESAWGGELGEQERMGAGAEDTLSLKGCVLLQEPDSPMWLRVREGAVTPHLTPH